MSIFTRSTTAVRLRSAGETDRGQIRQNNEDSFLVDDEQLLYAVADGLGGLPGGAVASRVAIRELAQQRSEVLSSDGVDFNRMIKAVNRRVQQEGNRIDPFGIGTTLTALSIEGMTARWGHVGDSALVLLRDGEASFLTREHTMLEALKERRAGPLNDVPEHFAHTLTRCVGQFGDLEVDTGEFTLQKGDRILLATDGISKVMALEEVERLSASTDDPARLVADLIALADQRGGRDNATAVVVFL